MSKKSYVLTGYDIYIPKTTTTIPEKVEDEVSFDSVEQIDNYQEVLEESIQPNYKEEIKVFVHYKTIQEVRSV